MIISATDLKTLKDLYDKSLHLQAFNFATSVAPLSEWEGTDAGLAAANLAHHLGAAETSDKWIAGLRRKDQTHSGVLYYRARSVFYRRGPLPALMFVRKYEMSPEAWPKHRAWWLSLQAEIFGRLRDFATTERFHKKSLEISPDDSWIWNCVSFNLEQQDRYEESLENARRAFELDGGQRSSVYQVSHILRLLERYDEALEILTDANARLENGSVTRQLCDLQTELGLHAEAFVTLERLVELSPMREEPLENWLNGALSDAAYEKGDLEKSREYAEKSKQPFHLKVRTNIENRPPDARRKKLEVGFLRQHQLTCAPATLANIGRFWKLKFEHLDVANEICYDGTPAHRERQWAEQNGWTTREFTVTWPDVIQLIDRGVPFTLATVQPGNGHLQAVVGYDQLRGTLLIRDPYYHSLGEALAEELLENQRSSGPRGMALVPSDREELLDGLDLFESRHYDFHHEIECALEAHDREKAARLLSDMQGEFPGHRLTWSARWTLARYDANVPGMIEAVRGLRELFPDDINLRMSDHGLSAPLISRADQLAMLNSFAKDKNTDPLIWQRLGAELGADAKSHGRALRWLYRALRRLHLDAHCVRAIADILWAQRRFEESAELYRFAACLNDRDENLSYSYFLASQFLKKEEESIVFLEDRVERFGHQANGPVRSLLNALASVGREAESFGILEKALARRPNDGELKLAASDLHARYGRNSEARDFLTQAAPLTARNIWLRSAAYLDYRNGDFANALAHEREASSLAPTSVDGHHNIAQLLSITEGRAATLEYLRKISRRFPHNLEIQRLRLQFLDEETAESVAVARDLVRYHPHDAWALRELARRLAIFRKYDKALEQARSAVEVAPNDPASHSMLAVILAAAGKRKEAEEEFRASIKLSVDHGHAIRSWLNGCRSNAEKLDALRYVREQLSLQTGFGEGLQAYRESARQLLEPKKLLAELRELHGGGSKDWFTLSAVVLQLGDMFELDEALELALKNTGRFPLNSQVWHDLALIRRLRGESQLEVDALQRAVSLNNSWSVAHQALIDALERAGRLDEAKAAALRAIARLPLDPYLHGHLASVSWRIGEKDDALAAARHAISIDPDYEWAWDSVRRWSEELKRPGLAAEMARELTERKPKDAHMWIILARSLQTDGFSPEQLAAAEKAIECDPDNEIAIAIKANCLSSARRFDEAIELCREKTVDGYRPSRLRYVEARIEASRGNIAGSIALLNALVADSPDYYAAWELLSSIYRDMPDKSRPALTVAREMARLAPHDGYVFATLGSAYFRNQLRKDAKEAFRQALVLAPDYLYAADVYFSLCFEDKETENCQWVMNLLERFNPGPPVFANGLLLAIRLDERERAKEMLKQLCLSAAARHDFDFVFEKLRELPLAAQDFVLPVMKSVAGDPDANAFVGRYLCQLTLKNKGETACRRLLSELRDGPVREQAELRFLEFLQESDRKSLQKYVSKNQARLRASTETWAYIGYALQSNGQMVEAERWLSDWKSRSEAPAWVMWNYSVVLRSLGRAKEARGIDDRAIGKADGEEVHLHLMMSALDDLQASDFGSAEEKFGQLNTSVFGDWEQFFYFLLRDGLEVHRLASAGQAREASELASEMITVATSSALWYKDKVRAKALRNSLRAVCRDVTGIWFRIKMEAKILASQATL